MGFLILRFMSEGGAVDEACPLIIGEMLTRAGNAVFY
jgi:hypothetical protein